MTNADGENGGRRCPECRQWVVPLRKSRHRDPMVAALIDVEGFGDYALAEGLTSPHPSGCTPLWTGLRESVSLTFPQFQSATSRNPGAALGRRGPHRMG